MSDGNGWNEWSKHVLCELERLEKEVTQIKKDVNSIEDKVKHNYEYVCVQKKFLDSWSQRLIDVVFKLGMLIMLILLGAIFHTSLQLKITELMRWIFK